MKELSELSEKKVKDLRQKSRVRWASFGDENSKFFHGFINNRKRKNSIPGLIINGEWCDKPKMIKKEIFGFYRKKFKEEMVSRPHLNCHNFKKLSNVDANYLIEKFSREEIKEAVFGCNGDMAPGPDGFNFKFIRHFWELFEEDFFLDYVEFS